MVLASDDTTHHAWTRTRRLRVARMSADYVKVRTRLLVAGRLFPEAGELEHFA
jgi:hypothetical protein